MVVREGRVLLMHRWNAGKEYYVFPGGGVEDGETIPEAVVREIREETTVEIQVGKLLYHLVYDDDSEQHFFLCEYVSGEPKPGDGPEFTNLDSSNRYSPEWMDIRKLPETLVYPLEVCDWFVVDFAEGLTAGAREEHLKVAERRETL